MPYVPILLSELSPAKLSLMDQYVSAFVQTSCPRLSIDWGYAFSRPLLSPYEAAIAVGKLPGWKSQSLNQNGRDALDAYPMNFYEAGTPWAISRSKGTLE